MGNILFFDTETTGIPEWKQPSNRKIQPHMVQLAAILADENTREIKDKMDVIIQPDGWIIPQDTIDVHGITNEIAAEKGIPEKEALQMYMKLHFQCDFRVAHNTTFDNRIIRIALKRYLPTLVEDEDWKNRYLFYCTLQHSRKIMGGKSGHTLPEAYQYFLHKEFIDGHNAMADTKACMEVYFAIQDKAEGKNIPF